MDHEGGGGEGQTTPDLGLPDVRVKRELIHASPRYPFINTP